jgi:hypothetical protein
MQRAFVRELGMAPREYRSLHGGETRSRQPARSDRRRDAAAAVRLRR